MIDDPGVEEDGRGEPDSEEARAEEGRRDAGEEEGGEQGREGSAEIDLGKSGATMSGLVGVIVYEIKKGRKEGKEPSNARSSRTVRLTSFIQHQALLLLPLPSGSSPLMILKSQARAVANPPAKQWPLMAAIVMSGKVSRREMKGEKVSAEKEEEVLVRKAVGR